MKFSNIKINGFGNLEDKELSFSNGINLITANNEAGKTTFTKCLQSMLFGISRNKNGRPISDYEKYKPWKDIPFSAKLEYVLDNGDSYEVFRDFSKRNVKVFNSDLEDVSGNYSIDKSKNSNYFVEQTNISEDIFMKTAIVSQQEVKLNKQDQNVILQKISNLVSTGDDTVSFKRLMDRLNRKQLDEIGTQRSSERPLNIVLNKIDNCKAKLQGIDFIRSKEASLKDKLDTLKKELDDIENQVSLLKELQNIRNNERIEYGQVDVLKKIISEYDEKIANAKKEADVVQERNSKKKKFASLFVVLLVIYTVLFFALSLPLPAIAGSAILFALSLYFFIKRESVPDTYTVLSSAQRDKEAELDALLSKFENVKLSSNDYIRTKYGNTPFLDMSYEEITSKLSEVESLYSEKRIYLNTLTVNIQNTSAQMEDLASVEEELSTLNEELADLTFLNNAINIAKDALNEAYEEMKNNITPEFTNYLSSVIAKVSDNKYSQVRFNDEDGLIVQLANGDYINCELLSLGTIDQMYISLRIAALKEISDEGLPLILDESFVYFDNNRLKNMLAFLSNEFEQVLIFSCSDREMNLLDELNISYTKHTL